MADDRCPEGTFQLFLCDENVKESKTLLTKVQKPNPSDSVNTLYVWLHVMSFHVDYLISYFLPSFQTPRLVDGLRKSTVHLVAAGQNHSVFVDTE